MDPINTSNALALSARFLPVVDLPPISVSLGRLQAFQLQPTKLKPVSAKKAIMLTAVVVTAVVVVWLLLVPAKGFITFHDDDVGPSRLKAQK